MFSAVNRVIALTIALHGAQAVALDAIKFDKKDGLFSAEDKTVPIVTAKYVGFARNWQWAGAKMKPNTLPPLKKTDLTLGYQGEVPKLDMDFSVSAAIKNQSIIWEYQWRKKQDQPDAIGFGIDFNLMLDSPSFTSKAQDPELLPNNEGWRWQTPDGNSIEVKFTPAMAKVFFERNQKNKIRVYFFQDIRQGTEKSMMSVKLTGQTIGQQSVAGEFIDSGSNSDKNGWHQNVLSDLASPVDLSFLNKEGKPAGKHGFVKAKGGQLVLEDGTPIRFWGTNVVASALFDSSDVDIKAHAKRIAQLGFNLVRIHHHDSGWVKHNIFKNQQDNTKELSSDALKKLDWWIHCLKEEGVYLWLDLHVGRVATKNDGIDKFDELAKRKGEIKGFNYYNESIQKQMQEFNQAYLSHVNPFTKLAYKDDPAVVALLLTNENDLTQHFGNLFLPVKGLPEHLALFQSDLNQFTKTTGWNPHKTGKTWEMGESKMYLGDAEHRFNQKMMAHLKQLGTKPLIATTNSWGKMGLFGLPSLTDGDLIDSHAYGKEGELKFNPRFRPGFLTWLGAAQATGLPLSVTEWNVEPFPVSDRHNLPLLTASVAGLQGWDAIMLYAYNQQKFGLSKKANRYSAFDDPSIIGLMPAAALLYRQQHVAPAKKCYELKLTKEEFFFKKQDPTTSKSIRTLLETSCFSVTIPEIKELPWVKQNPALPNSISVTDVNQDFIPEGQDYVQSDTGELKRDWVKGIHTINTDKSQIVSGWIGGETIALKDVSFKIGTKNAVAAVQSLDNQPLVKSKRIFITLLGQSLPKTGVNLPFLSEPVAGEISIKALSGMLLYPIDSQGKTEKPIKLAYDQGKYQFKLNSNNKYHWFELKKN